MNIILWGPFLTWSGDLAASVLGKAPESPVDVLVVSCPGRVLIIVPVWVRYVIVLRSVTCDTVVRAQLYLSYHVRQKPCL